MTGRDLFELRETDAAGRIGELRIPRAGTTIETPALLPVINPHLQTLAPPEIVSLGADIVITNAYILHQSDDLASTVRTNGVHDVLDISVPIMTDSGSFQLSSYGELDVTTEEILAFQYEIGSGIATPIDIPTPPDADRETARDDLERTQERLEIAASFDRNDMLITAPIQGSTYPDLREHAAQRAYDTSLDLFPIGGMVPLLNDYRFSEIVSAIAAAKRGLGADAPVHLFGAGHPMMFSLAVVLGCDLFDSAAYALYAREDRYLTVRGTQHLETIREFPCHCPICTEYTPDALRNLDTDHRISALAAHNLHVSFGEIRTIKHAIRTGSLLDLVDARARAHPALLDGYRALAQHTTQLEHHDPVRKNAFFYLSAESNHRPEIKRYHDRLARLAPPDPLVLRDDVLPPETTGTSEWPIIPPFGPVPPALRESYPVSGELPTLRDPDALMSAARGIEILVESHPASSVTVRHHDWPSSVLAILPDRISIQNDGNTTDSNHDDPHK